MAFDPSPTNEPTQSFAVDAPATSREDHSTAQPQIDGYDILGELGRGGMAVVYRARQKSLDRTVAVKVLVAGHHADKDLLARFRAEAEVVARLQHPNIVQVHEVGTTRGCPFLSLEFLAGGSLAERLKKQPLPPREAAALVRTLALAMQAAHDAGIIHRDLKPANILLAADGSPKIADFGLAKQLSGSQMTRTGDIMGTPSYMAPEQASGAKTIGPTCDIYALGAILYELLSGGPPFRGHEPMEVVLQVLSQEPISLRKLAPKTPRDLETICIKCLEKQPQKRYPTASALADDLLRYLDGETIHARPASRIEKTWKWAHRRPALAALIVVSALSLSTFLGYGVWKNRQLTEALDTTAVARDRAEANLRRAIDAVSRRISHTGDRSENPLAEELGFFEEIRSQPGNDPTIQHERALAAGWAGYVYSELNNNSAAEKAFAESTSTLASLNERFPENSVYRRDCANFIARYAAFLSRVGDNEGSKREYTKSIEILEPAVKQFPADRDFRYLLATQYNNLARVTGALGGDGEPIYRRALEMRQQLIKDFPNVESYRYDLNVTQMNLSALMTGKQKYAEAERVLRDCIAGLSSAPADLKGDATFRQVSAAAHLNLGNALKYQNKMEEAAREYAAGIQIVEKLVEAFPKSVPYRTMLIDSFINVSKLRIAQEQYALAIAPTERVVQLYAQLATEFPDEASYVESKQQYQQALDQLHEAAK